MNSDELITLPVTYADNATFTWTESHTEWMRTWMLDNQFFNIPYKNKWSRLLGEMGLGLNNDIDETVRKFLTARLETKVAVIRKSLVEGGRIKEIASTKGGLKFKITNQSEAVNLKALIDRVYSDIPVFEETMEAAYGQWNKSKLSTTEDLLAEQSLDNITRGIKNIL